METKKAFQKPTFLLPKKDIDMEKWAIIACDQFTSQPEYWQKVESLVGDAPSTYRLILPEAYLEIPRAEQHSKETYAYMQKYLEEGVLDEHKGYVLVERELDHNSRSGLMLNLDLEEYDFNKGSQSLIRATEGTILDRLPPRIKIREKAPIEIPHIMVLIDDREDELFSYLRNNKDNYSKLYDFTLMQGSGSIKGYLLDENGEKKIAEIFGSLIEPKSYAQKYGLEEDEEPLLFAVGDGNHSLATAKSIWDSIKDSVPADHPARYALVEIVNIHDISLNFEPIHRVLFNSPEDILSQMKEYFNSKLETQTVNSSKELKDLVEGNTNGQVVGMVHGDSFQIIKFLKPTANLPVGTLQNFLDDFLKESASSTVDYVHGDDVLTELGQQAGNTGFLLPAMQKNDFFQTVILDGSLPRKTFSMGDAKEKRFYLECRKIQ